ncbi:hypothetical protein, partial [Bradyrhizobium sp. 150]|uniref:hypothetical protein n=1 Tax=Bradyrhizobium sp. 150 TaxID=2782625 RepID=UPI001FF9BC05
DHRLPSQGVHLFWWTPHASEHSKAKGAGKFALTVKPSTKRFAIDQDQSVNSTLSILSRLHGG